MIVAAYAWSGWYVWNWAGPHVYVAIRDSTILLEHHDNPSPYSYSYAKRRTVVRYTSTQPWNYWNTRYAWTPSVFSRNDIFWNDSLRGGWSITAVLIPFWVPFVVAASLTVFLWRRDRPPRVKPGHCPCGYDLRGNESGVCSECGIEVQA